MRYPARGNPAGIAVLAACKDADLSAGGAAGEDWTPIWIGQMGVFFAYDCRSAANGHEHSRWIVINAPEKEKDRVFLSSRAVAIRAQITLPERGQHAIITRRKVRLHGKKAG